MSVQITPEHIAAAKRRVAELLWLRLRIARVADPDSSDADPALQRAMLNTITGAIDPDEPEGIIALVLCLIQYGWMTSEFVAFGVGRDLDEEELQDLLDVFMADDSI
jgi:hypothetical protein